MDTYKRGYDSSIGDANLGLGEDGQIGTATILNPLSLGRSQSVLDDWQAAGFYASAYKLTADVGTLSPGTIVISYRGTDNPNPLAEGSDFWNGWTLGGRLTRPSARATSGPVGAAA